MYNPDPINLLTPAFASPVKAPVAELGRTLERRNFLAVARRGNKAGRNPPSTFICDAAHVKVPNRRNGVISMVVQRTYQGIKQNKNQSKIPSTFRDIEF